VSHEPLTREEALKRAEWCRQEAYIRLRSMGIGGQRYHDRMMAEADKWERFAKTLPKVEDKQ